MTSLRWDNVPKPRVERPPLLAPSSKSARRKQTPPDLKDRIEGAGGRGPGYRTLPAPHAPLARLAPIGNPGGVRRVRPEASRCGGFGPFGVRQLPRGDVGGVSPVPAAGADEHTAHES